MGARWPFGRCPSARSQDALAFSADGGLSRVLCVEQRQRADHPELGWDRLAADVALIEGPFIDYLRTIWI